jgi:hypothetical protein
VVTLYTTRFSVKRINLLPAQCSSVFCRILNINGINRPLFSKRDGPCFLSKGRVKFTIEQATKAQRGSRGIALLLL